MKLSILIPTLVTRVSFFNSIKTELEKQINQGKFSTDIEIISVLDNREKTIGSKRNILLGMSKGDFLTFIDDDDFVSPDYIEEVMNAIKSNPLADCIVYDSIYSLNGKIRFRCHYSIDYDYSNTKDLLKNNGKEWFGKPAHTMVWRSSLAKKHKFPNKSRREDFEWVAVAYKDIKKEIKIDKVLYYYNAVSKKKY